MHMVDPSFLVDWIRLTFIYIFLILCLNLKNIFYIEITYKLTVKKKADRLYTPKNYKLTKYVVQLKTPILKAYNIKMKNIDVEQTLKR